MEFKLGDQRKCLGRRNLEGEMGRGSEVGADEEGWTWSRLSLWEGSELKSNQWGLGTEESSIWQGQKE